MSKNDEEYHSSEDEDYLPPVDAPPENENDAYLIVKEGDDDKKSSEPTKGVDDLWADFLKPTSSSSTESTQEEPTKTEPSKPESVTIGTKRKPETKKSSGLDSALSLMKKAKKTTVLQKSQQDWNKFVEEKSMKEELDSHTRSQNSYLDKQEFMAKADYNKFLKEKESRELARKPL